MKYLKRLGTTAVTVTALVAFTGAGTASAETTLCKDTSGTECAGAETTVKGETTTGGATLTAPFGNITCSSTIEGNIEKATTPSGKVTKVTITGCTGGTAEAVTLGSGKAHWDAEHNGTGTLEGMVVKVVQAGVTCYWTSEGHTSTITGGTTPIAHVTYEATIIDDVTHNSSAFCPSKAPFHATFAGTSTGYVVSGV